MFRKSTLSPRESHCTLSACVWLSLLCAVLPDCVHLAHLIRKTGAKLECAIKFLEIAIFAFLESERSIALLVLFKPTYHFWFSHTHYGNLLSNVQKQVQFSPASFSPMTCCSLRVPTSAAAFCLQTVLFWPDSGCSSGGGWRRAAVPGHRGVELGPWLWGPAGPRRSACKVKTWKTHWEDVYY